MTSRKILIAAGLLLVLGVAAREQLRAPDIRIIGTTLSPDGKWAAIIEEEQYPSIFTPSFYAIVLRPQEGWFPELQEKIVFEASNAGTPPSLIVFWRGENDLMIQTTIVKKEIVIRLSRYKDINISVGVPVADVGCVGDARVRGRCFDVSGTLSVGANMRMYLQPDNAKHRLVVSYKPNAPEADPPLPHELAKIIYSGINKVV